MIISGGRGAVTSGFSAAGGASNAAGKGMLATLGLDETTIAMILEMGSSYIFETGSDWSIEVPHVNSLTAQIVKTVSNVTSMNEGLISYFSPIMSSYNDIKAAKKRILFRDMTGGQRDAVEAVFMAMPAFELGKVNDENIVEIMKLRLRDKIHPIIDKLLP